MRLTSVLAVVVAIASFAQAQTYADITVEEAFSVLSSDPTIFLLDVRTQEEYEEGHIPGGHLLPHSELDARLDELPTDLAAPIVVYCWVGGRSAYASEYLANLGYRNVSNILGGFSDWMGRGYPFVTGPEQGVFLVAEPTLIMGVLSLPLPCWVLARRRVERQKAFQVRGPLAENDHHG